MSARLPFAYLEGEAAAWPFWSESAFRASLCAIEERVPGVVAPPADRVAEHLDEHLRLRARGLSIDALAHLRHSVWLDGARPGPSAAPRRVRLHEMLLGLAERQLEIGAGGKVSLRVATNETKERVAERWRWLSLALPADLLVAARTVAAKQSFAACDHVMLLPESLKRSLARTGIADLHLHLGAAMSFEMLWTNLVSTVLVEPPDPAILESSGSVPFGSGVAFVEWLTTAALARLVLAHAVWDEPGRGNELVDEGEFTRRLNVLAGRSRDPELLLAAIASLAHGRRAQARHRVQGLLRGLVPPRRREPRTLVEFARADPLWAWCEHRFRRFRNGRFHALPETHLLAASLRAIAASPALPSGSLHERLFWQYVRVRGRTFRFLAEEPGTAGLDWFSRHFVRARALRGKLERVLVECAVQLESRDRSPVRCLELRTSPDSSWQGVRRQIRDVARDLPARRRSASPCRALVLHFIKQGRRDPRSPEHADPRQLPYRCRYGSYFAERRREAIAIAGALARDPSLLAVLRGLDVCNLELTIPTWVFQPLISRIRSEAARVAEVGGAPPLGLTLHVGEEFSSLVEGLRRIHEPIEFGLLGNGDRLGHAVALGVDPETWARGTRGSLQPALERLDDLLWLLARVREYPSLRREIPAGCLEEECSRLGRDIYGEETDVEILLAARSLRHRPGVLAALGYPYLRLRSPPAGEALRSLWLYLTDPDVYLRGRRPVPLHPLCESRKSRCLERRRDSELRLMAALQDRMKRICVERAITVEVNPTSNMLIGELSIDDHAVFRLRPLPGRTGIRVPVALGDDDPITFATSVCDEYAYLFFALRRRGVRSRAANDWIAALARQGMRATFALPNRRRWRPTPRRGAAQTRAPRGQTRHEEVL